MPKPWEVDWSHPQPMTPPNPDVVVKSATIPTQIQQVGADLGKTRAETAATVQNARVAAAKAPSEIALATAQAAEAAQKATNEKQKEYLRRIQGVMSADNVLKAIREAQSHIGNWTTGLPGEVGSHIPGTEAYTLAGNLGTVKGNISFDAYTQMKENMPEGAQGGIRLTDQEQKLLGALQGDISQGNTRQALITHLDNIEQKYRRDAALAAGLDPEDPTIQRTLGIRPSDPNSLSKALLGKPHGAAPASRPGVIDFHQLPAG